MDIRKPDYIALTPEVARVLQLMFSPFKRIAIEAEFGYGFSGSRVFRVRPLRDTPPAPLPLAVKIGPSNLIRWEWQAYQAWVAHTLPDIARLEAPPALPDDSRLGGLCYALAGEGVFAVQSLAAYYRQANTIDLRQVLHRLFQIMGQQWWLDNRAVYAFQMAGDYDALLPVNLLIKAVHPPAEAAPGIIEIEPDNLPPASLAPGAYVRLKEFAIVEVNLAQSYLTLNLPYLPEAELPRSYRLRLVGVADIDRYQAGQLIEPIEGLVEAGRRELLVAQAGQVLGEGVDLSTDQLILPPPLTPPPLAGKGRLPNPLAFYQAMLQDFLKVNISTIHGDLNLENILVDPATHSISLIDFATARRGHVLHDLLRLETGVVTGLLPLALAEAGLGPETIYDLYRHLHDLICQPGRFVVPWLPHLVLEKPFAILRAIRNMARKCLFDADDWTEYYQGLSLYLLGALKFKTLDDIPKAKQVAFLGAATLVELRNRQATPTQGVAISEDGHIIADDDILPPPLPEFDPRFLETLEAPGGAVMLRDTFYVEREADAHLKRQLVRWGTTTTIRAPRQTGKTSLLMRGIHYAQSKAKVIYFDFQSFGREQLARYDLFLYTLAKTIGDECNLDEQLVEQTWQRPRSPSKKLEYLLEKSVLPGFDRPLVLAMDEADYLLQSDYYKDFFGLLRSWHNRRSFHRIWEKLNLILVISTEPYLLIDDIHQSPFNVGLELGLSDFDEAQVSDLNRRHGSPVAEPDLPHFLELLNGHPFLTRLALYTMVVGGIDWPRLAAAAPTDQGPFGRHLQHQYWIIHDKPELIGALKEIVRTGHCSDEKALLRLQRAGLVKREGDVYAGRCGLYQLYFKHKLS